MDNLWITIGTLIAWPRVGMGLALVAIGMPLVTLAHLLLGVWVKWGAYSGLIPYHRLATIGRPTEYYWSGLCLNI